MTSNSHSTMDDLESEDNTTANPNEQDLANCEGENANLNRQGGAAKKKKQLIMKAVIYMYIIASAFVLIGCIHWTLVGVVRFLYLSLVLSILFVSNTSIRAVNKTAFYNITYHHLPIEVKRWNKKCSKNLTLL